MKYRQYTGEPIMCNITSFQSINLTVVSDKYRALLAALTLTVPGARSLQPQSIFVVTYLSPYLRCVFL